MKGPVITQFIFHLSSLTYSATIIISNILAASFVYKLNDRAYPGDSFVVRKMLTR